MGLGKSLSIVSLAHCFSRYQINKGNKSQILVICPTTLISNWNREFLKWLPRGSEEGSDEVRVLMMDKNHKTLGDRVNRLREWQRHATGAASGVKKGVRFYMCVYICMYACMHVCMYACMHVCMYACMHVCEHTHTHVKCSHLHDAHE